MGELVQNFNVFGDQINNKESEVTPELSQIIATVEPPEVTWKYIHSSQGMVTIEEFIQWCRHHQIEVLATWPNTVYFDDCQDQKHQAFFQIVEDFYQRLEVPVLGNPEDFMYEKALFFDTIYHLNDRGTKIRTTQLIPLLKPYLKS